jgi:uncharacterized protein (DUF433 family)
VSEGVAQASGPAGPRATLAGTGLDVWEIVDAVRAVGNHVERAARYLGLDEGQVRAALRQDAAAGGPAAARIARERALAEEAGRRLRRPRPPAS